MVTNMWNTNILLYICEKQVNFNKTDLKNLDFV